VAAPRPEPADAVRDARIAFRLRDFGGYDKGRSVLWQAAWIAVQHMLFKRWWFPRRWRPAVLRAFGATVGTGVQIRDGVYLTWPWLVSIGDDVWIGRNVYLLTSTKITIGHDTCISQDVMLLSSGHDPYAPDFRVYDFPITIGNHVWVCARAMILHGVRLPDHTIVNANAVVRFGQPIRRANTA
jgi:putative colanic acid biosynthesis acetyltransferase WcaF